VSEEGWTPLHYAAQGRPRTCSFITTRRWVEPITTPLHFRPSDIHLMHPRYRNMLTRYALSLCSGGHVEVVKELLKRGEVLRMLCHFFCISEGRMSGTSQSMCTCLTRGSDWTTFRSGVDERVRDQEGRTAMDLATHSGLTDVVTTMQVAIHFDLTVSIGGPGCAGRCCWTLAGKEALGPDTVCAVGTAGVLD
jgi:hypothetical protein